MATQNMNSNPDKILIEEIITISDKINLDKAKIKKQAQNKTRLKTNCVTVGYFFKFKQKRKKKFMLILQFYV